MTKLPSHLGGHCNITHCDIGVLNYFADHHSVKTAYDLGCGPGWMVKEMMQRNIFALGIDGDYTIDRGAIPCVIMDFEAEKADPRDFPAVDLCWSVEFLEHVSEKYMENYFPIFQRSAIIFVTASPTMVGHHHVNVHDCVWWIEEFEKRGFAYSPHDTKMVRELSTMHRDFVRDTGLVFLNPLLS